MLVVCCPSSTSSSPIGTLSHSLGACYRPSSRPWVPLPGMTFPRILPGSIVHLSWVPLGVLLSNSPSTSSCCTMVLGDSWSSLHMAYTWGFSLCPVMTLLTSCLFCFSSLWGEPDANAGFEMVLCEYHKLRESWLLRFSSPLCVFRELMKWAPLSLIIQIQNYLSKYPKSQTDRRKYFYCLHGDWRMCLLIFDLWLNRIDTIVSRIKPIWSLWS